MLVVRVRRRLAAPLLVALDRAQVGDLDDDGLAEGARVCGRVRIPVSSECEAAAACVAGAQTWCRAEGELAHGCGVSVPGDATRWRSAVQMSQSSDCGSIVEGGCVSHLAGCTQSSA